MQQLYADYLLLDVSHRFQVLFFVCLLIIFVIVVLALSIAKIIKELAEK